MASPTLTGEKLQLEKYGGAYPLYITSDKVTPALIDKFLYTEFKLNRVDEADRLAILPTFYLVTDKSVPDPSTLVKQAGGYRDITAPIKTLSVPPTLDFKSPYLGKSVEELVQIHKKHFSANPFSWRLFVVFDERTARDENTVLLVEDTEEFKDVLDGQSLMRARCEFGYAGWSLAGPNGDNSFLTEGRDMEEWRDV